MAQLRRPEAIRAAVRLDARTLELGQPGDSLAIGRVHTPGQPVGQLGMKRLRTALLDLALDLIPDLAGNARSQVKLCQRRAQVQARAADHDRAPPLCQQPVDLKVGELAVAPGAELLGRVDERKQPMLEPSALLPIRRPAQDLEPAIDLDRVAVDRNRILAALAQPLGDRDRNPGLAHRSGSEQGEDLDQNSLISGARRPALGRAAQQALVPPERL